MINATRLATAAAVILCAASPVVVGIPPAAARSVPPPTDSTAVITVKTGGDRTGDLAVGPLAGVRLGLFDSQDATDPVNGDWAVCTSDGDGDCNFVVPESATGTSFYVKQISAPGGWYTNPVLRTGRGSGSNSVATPYVFRTPAIETGQTYSSTEDFMIDDTRANPLASEGIWQQSRVNPGLPTSCGIDVALVLDLSASVGSALDSLKGAADTFTDSLVGTASRMALFTFDRRSPSANTQNYPGLTSVSTQAGADEFKERYAGWQLGSGTNWDQALWTVAQAAPRYDLVVVLTDGNPTFYDDLRGDGSNTRISEVEAGIFSANAVKAEGSRVLAMGVGRGVEGLTALNLRAISGPTAFNGSNVESADYFQTGDYDAAGRALHDLAVAHCAGTLTVVKQIVPATNTGDDITGAEPAGAGWTFDASTTTPGIGGLPDSQTTRDDGTGSVGFELTYSGGVHTGDVLVEERQQNDFTLVTPNGRNAVCADLNSGDPVPVVNSGGTGFTVAVPDTGAISCVVYNRSRRQIDLTVDKTWVVNDMEYPEGEQPEGLNATLTLDGSTHAWGVPSGDHALGDTVTIDETVDLADRNCELTGQRVTEVNGESEDRDLPFEAELTREHSSYVVTNTVACAGGDWNVDKSSDPPSGTEVAPGDEITYRVTVRPENGVANDVVVTDDLSGLFSSTEPVRGSLRVTTGEVTRDGNTLVWRVPVLDQAQSLTFRVRVTSGGHLLENEVVPGPGGDCEHCTTKHPVVKTCDHKWSDGKHKAAMDPRSFTRDESSTDDGGFLEPDGHEPRPRPTDHPECVRDTKPHKGGVHW